MIVLAFAGDSTITRLVLPRNIGASLAEEVFAREVVEEERVEVVLFLAVADEAFVVPLFFVVVTILCLFISSS